LKTILIVEDTELNIDLLIQLLDDDYNLIVARDGAQAVALAEQEEPDLVLMDISLPIMDGFEATHHIRATFPSLPIIGLSAHAMQGVAENAIAEGFTDYMTKPIDENLLRTKLKDHLG
jgi:two-component system cell cycle response regulator DivK